MLELTDSVQKISDSADYQHVSTPLPRMLVLLAAYNGLKFINEQLASILKQKNVEVSVYISVDRSDDGTEQWAADFTKSCDKVFLLSCGDRYGGAARNFFRLLRDVDFSGFDYVALADQDDIWLEDKLYRAHECIQRDRYDAYSGNVLAFWPDGREVLVNKAQPQVEHDYLFEAAGPGCTYVFTVASALQMKAFTLQHWQAVNEIALHDWFFYAWYRTRGLRWYIDNEWYMRYRQHGSNQIGVNKGFSAIISRISLLRSNWYRLETVKIASLVGSNSDEIVSIIRRNGWLAHVALLPHISQLRRRLGDRVFLFFIILLGFY